MAGGIILVSPTPGVWTQLPSQAASQGIFQSGEFEIAQSASPGNVIFHVFEEDPPFAVPAGHMANTNELWIRSNEPVSFFWTT